MTCSRIIKCPPRLLLVDVTACGTEGEALMARDVW